ncbi:glycerophosphoryl diester phosphodiesterase membrane domain-containing protein [Crassaminicella profunda]|uniref:glycerophosphoryl diester phosphodiesterase membrane domain-containing protein n=1 Tax=Crassaminicella profunda TaxID=1286698 RepID=UPI001CA72D42|nr:glycerophosphoryl diester phosphodiesterase membrane domain-containing protein [Crassaminicella profunda]QZY56413.1 glycerophosphoryl diester phosphodiesterase membrane domain-containing protein [Crassaminicella profunda]
MKEWFNEKITDAKVLDLSMEVYKKKLKSLIGYQIMFAIAVMLIVFAGGLLLIPMVSFITLDGTFGFICFCTIMFIGMVTVSCMGKAGAFHITYGYVNGENVDAFEAVGRAFSSFMPCIRVTTALAICLLPIVIIMGVMGVTTATITVFANQLKELTFFGIMMNILIYAFIGAVIGSYLFYSLHIAIFDKEKGFKSIKKSIKFAKGEVLKNTFRVMSIVMFEWGIKVSIYAGIGGICTLLYFALGKINGGDSLISQIMMYVQLAQPFINIIVGILLGPVGPIMWTLYYVNMKYKKEGFKIHNMIETLKVKKEPINMKPINLSKE